MAINENMVVNIVAPKNYKTESWSGSMSNGQGTVVKTIVGEESKVSDEYNKFCAAYGTITVLNEKDCPFKGLQCMVTSASYEVIAPGMARATQTFTTPSYNNDIGNSVADAAKEQHIETSDVSVTERNIRYAPFWVKAFENDPTTEAKAWKAIQTFLDTSVESKEEAETLLNNAVGFVDSGTQGNAVRKMVCLRMGGVDAFYYPIQTISVSEVSKNMREDVGSGVGTIGSPKNLKKINPDGSLEWLKMSDKVSWDGVSFHIERQWAGALSWDKDLYGNGK